MDRKFSLEWHSILRDVIRNFWVIICAVLVALMGTYIAHQSVYSPVYTSSATLIINSAAGKANAYASLAESSEIASIYTEVFIQPAMKRKVCENLGTDKFDGSISAYVNSGTNIMELSVTSSNPENSYKELCAILKVYPQLTSSLFRNGAVSVLKMPTVPKYPSNSMTSSNMIKVSLAAIVVALVVIVILSAVRDTVKDETSFKEKIDSNLLAVIPHENKNLSLKEILDGKKKSILIYESSFISLKFTENFNKLSAKFEYMKRNNGDNVFAITSVAENEGKSTIASNIAISLAVKGNSVVLVDLDGKKPALYKIFEEEYEPNCEFGDFLSGEIPAEDFKFKRYRKSKLFLALNTKSHKDFRKWFETGTVEKVIDALKKTSDYVIIDTPPISVSSEVTHIAKLCDKSIVVVRTDSVYASVINDMMLTLSNTGADIAGCILNDAYQELSFFGSFGVDETGYYTRRYYGKYSKYSKYGKYGKYSKYSKYGKYGKYSSYSSYDRYSKYAKYSKYSKYSKYGHYSKYSKYADPGAIEDIELTAEDMPLTAIEENDNGGSI